jgi:hypothetical protein
MPRMRVEGLFNSFPKLLDKPSQHTFIETESVRCGAAETPTTSITCFVTADAPTTSEFNGVKNTFFTAFLPISR